MQETQVQSLGWEDSLEKETATHSSIFAWRIPWTDKPGGATVYGVEKESNSETKHNKAHSITDDLVPKDFKYIIYIYAHT